MQKTQRIPLQGVQNTRDLGGLRTMDGKTICPHRLIRSGRLDGLTEEDMRILLDEYDVKTVVDFRTDSEREETPNPDLENVTILLHSILDAREMGAMHSHKFADLKTHSAFVDAMHAGLIDPDEFFGIFYRGLISSPHAIENFRAFFETLLKQETGAVLWHCTAGQGQNGHCNGAAAVCSWRFAGGYPV